MTASARTKQYFVDEAGDSVLFDTRGRVVIGQEGCSKYFILGLLDVLEPYRLARELEELRQNLLADPYFRNVPSMQSGAGKTALVFHAKDDLPEVRREVFSLLLRHRMRFLAVVRDKRAVLTGVTEHNRRDAAYRYRPNELYDYMVMRLCKSLLHKADEYDIWFARRGSRDRTQALQAALAQARHSFANRWGINSAAPIRVHAAYPHECVTLQATDYFLWALQRLYERREDRYVELLWSAVEFVQDIDDKREKPYGMYYDKKKPLSAAALENLPGI